MKIAIISDIHGNLEALNAVFSDIEKKGIEKCFCLGDVISKGMNSSECVDLVKEKCDVVILGNNEEKYCIPDCEYDEEKLNNIRYREIYNQVSEGRRKYLSNVPFSHEFYMSGNLVRLVHSSPKNTSEIVWSLDDIRLKRELFMPSEFTCSNDKADVLVFGHIHVPMLEKMYNRTLINPGSVGESVELIRNDEFNGNNNLTTNANYLVMEGKYGELENKSPISFEFAKVPYDVEKELASKVLEYKNTVYELALRQGIYPEADVFLNKALERGNRIDLI